MFSHTIAFMLVYVFAVGGLMYANTVWFGLGDVKFGASGWELYWPLWSVFYAPIAVAAIAIVWCSGLSDKKRVGLLWLSLMVTLASLEMSFFLDIDWRVLLTEWLALPLVFIQMGRFAKAA